MKAKKYFDEEYGNDHIKDVVDLKDLESLYGLMQEYADEQLRLHNVSGSLPSKDEAVGKGFNNANGSEYNRRNVLRDDDYDLYYTGWMDCFDWLAGNDR